MRTKMVKIDVYLLPKQKAQIQQRAAKLALSVSDYLRLKGLNQLAEEKDD